MRKTRVLMVGNHPSAKGGITSVISQLLAHDWDADGIEMRFIPTYIEAGALKKSLFFAHILRKRVVVMPCENVEKYGCCRR